MQTLSVLSRLKPALFVYNLDLLVEYLAGKLADRHACLAEALAKAGAPSNAAHLSRQIFVDQASAYSCALRNHFIKTAEGR
jgi:hypothetical protein